MSCSMKLESQGLRGRRHSLECGRCEDIAGLSGIGTWPAGPGMEVSSSQSVLVLVGLLVELVEDRAGDGFGYRSK